MTSVVDLTLYLVRFFRRFSCAASIAAAIGLCFAGEARALVIDAAADIWIRESAPDTAYPDDLISVWDGTTTDQRRHSVILFDLSSTVGVTINSAFLSLFDRDDTRSANSPLTQQAFILNSTPPTFPAMFEEYTWAEYAAFDEGANETAFSSLGSYTIPAGDSVDGYESSGLASTADITLLTNTRNAQSGARSNLVVFVLKASAGERDWGDLEFDQLPPRLYINEQLPVTGDFTGDGRVTIADYDAMVDPANWLQEVPRGTRGDLTQDGFVDLNDFSGFKPIYLAANPGVPFASVVPEPATLASALVLSGFTLLLGRRRKPTDSAFGPLACAAMHRAAFVRRRLDDYQRSRTAWIWATAVSALAMAPAAQAITLEATSDVWIRESSPDRAPFESDLLSVWNSFGNDGARRYGIIEFDVSSLSGVDITFAGLQLWDATNGFSDDAKPIKQSAVAINTTGGTQIGALTWNILQSEYLNAATPLDGLGRYDLPNQESPDAFQNSIGSAADQALIKSIADNSAGNKLLTLVLIADETDEVDYAHSWGDGADGFGGMNAQLVINEPFPEVVNLTLQINTATGAISIVNPGMDPNENTAFEIDGYVIQSPADDGLDPLNPAGFTGLTGAGKSGWDIVAPTTNALSELSLTSSLTLNEGDSFSLGTAYVAGAAEDPGLTFQYNMAGGATALGKVVYVTTPTGPDQDGDGDVDGVDFLAIQRTDPGLIPQWAALFGTTAAQAAAAAIPEPNAWLLVGGGGCALSMTRRRY